MKNRENIPEREQNVQGLEPRKNIIYSRSYIQFHVARVENEMSLESRESIVLCGELESNAASLGSEGRGSGESGTGRGQSDRGFCPAVFTKMAKRCSKAEVLHFTFVFHGAGEIHSRAAL